MYIHSDVLIGTAAIAALLLLATVCVYDRLLLTSRHETTLARQQRVAAETRAAFSDRYTTDALTRLAEIRAEVNGTPAELTDLGFERHVRTYATPDWVGERIQMH